jgi:cell division protein FtsB
MWRRSELDARAGEVRELEGELKALQRKLAVARRPDALERQARRLGLVRPGERLFVVKGVQAWRRSQRNG